MYRPAPPSSNVREAFFSEKNYMTLETVLMQEFQEKNGGRPLTAVQAERMNKMLNHYLPQVYQRQGDKPLVTLNREVLTVCARDFSQYMQRREAVPDAKAAIHTVATTSVDSMLFQDTSQRYERLTQDRNDAKAMEKPPTIPDFRISLSEDGPSAAELFERAKKAREADALRVASMTNNEMVKAEAGLQQRVLADSSFRSQQTLQNQSIATQAAGMNQPRPTMGVTDLSLVVLPDRRDLFQGAVGSFDGMTGVGNPTIVKAEQSQQPQQSQQQSLAAPLPQDVVVREEKIVNYREVENNLFIYSADRDWLRNNKENRYHFTVNFDPAANGQSFGPSLSSQQKFRNIVRIELVKAIMPGESLGVTVQRVKETRTTNTGFQDNVLNLPYVSLRVEELENNNYGTDSELDRSFGVLQYDAQWLSDTSIQGGSTKGYLAMIPKHLKCQKEYYPTPLSTLQKMTIDIRRPSGDLVSTSADTFDLGGILAPQPGEILGPTFPFTNSIKFGESPLHYNVMIPSAAGASPALSPANFFLNTVRYFSRFEVSPGDRIQVSGYTYAEEALNDPTYGQSLRAFCSWINRPEGHIVLDVANSVTLDLSTDTTNLRDSYNDVGYANFIVIQARYQDPSTGSVLLDAFGPNFGATLNSFGVSLQSPVRLINLNKQTHVVFRIITREMDSLPQLRPDNNY